MSPVRFFYDCEFLEDGSTIELISIGLVREDNATVYYGVNSDMPVDRIREHKWLMENVWPNLPLVDYKPEPGMRELDMTSSLVKPKWVIANEVRDFLLPSDVSPKDIQLWGYYSAYDHVVLAQLWGPMVEMPEGLPHHTKDIKQEIERLNSPKIPPQNGQAHNALDDAYYNLYVLNYLEGGTWKLELDQ